MSLSRLLPGIGAAFALCLLAGCSDPARAYRALADGDWRVAEASDSGDYTDLGSFSPDLVADSVRGGRTIRFSYRYTDVPPGDGLFIGVPFSYSYVRIDKSGRELYSAGSPDRKPLGQSRKYIMIRSPGAAGDLIEVFARMSPCLAPARPFVAMGDERFFLERLWAKNFFPLVISLLNILAFLCAVAVSLGGRLRPSVRRLFLWGGISLGIALTTLPESPLAGLYGPPAILVNALEDLAAFSLFPLVLFFIADTVPIAARPARWVFRAALLIDGIAAAWGLLSPFLFSGFLYPQTFILFDILCVSALGLFLVFLLPAAVFRKGDERLISAALSVFILGAALGIVSDLFDSLAFLARFSPLQTGFALMSIGLGSTVFGRYERLRVRIAEKKPVARGTSARSPADDRLCGKLEYLLDTEKVWNDESLTLPKLAAALDAPPHEVSRLINGRYGVNFNTLMNDRRIAEARRLLSSTDYTILRIALESGFNSKSAFYRFFKQEVGMTPVQYRESADIPSSMAGSRPQTKSS